MAQSANQTENLTQSALDRTHDTVGLISRIAELTGKTNRHTDADIGSQQKKTTGFAEREEDESVHASQSAPDGYMRVSPVQRTRVSPDYNKRIVWRVIKVVILAVIIIAIAWLLIREGVFKF